MSAAILNLAIDQGSTFVRTLILKDGNGDTIDLTGSTLRGQIKTKAGAAAVGAFTFVISNQTSYRGQAIMSLTAAETTALPMEKQTGARLIPKVLAYDIEQELSDGTVTRLLQGTLTVSPEITT